MFDTTQKQIFDAATKLFGEKGYEATSIREIAEKAGVNVASLNYYFGSKEELFKMIFRECCKSTQQIIDVMNEEPESIDGLKTTLKSFFKMFVRLRIDDSNAFYFINRNLELLVELDPETFEKNIWTVKMSLATLFKKAQKNKLIKKQFDSDQLAFMTFASFGHLLRDESIICKFSKTSSVFDEEYRNDYINQVINCLIDGAREIP